MAIVITDPAAPHLPDEKQVSIRDEDGYGVIIHPWDRPGNVDSRQVAIVAGSIDGFEDDTKDHTDVFNISIVNREDFVEALLAVLPELKRA